MTGPAQIRCWPVGGSVWLRAQDVTAAMRARAEELAEASNGTSDHENGLAWAACAEELRRQADQLDASVSMALTS